MSIQVRPFIGPQAFQEADRFFFYGRDREVQEILTLILSSSVSLIYAKSGIGKSSIFNAKIIPELQGGKRKFHVLPVTRFKTISAVNQQLKKTEEIPNIYVFNALQSIVEKSDPKITQNNNLLKVNLQKKTLSQFLNEYRIPRDENITTKYYREIKVLIFDQFEEFFNIYVNNRFEQQIGFFYQIRDAVNNDPNLRIVFIMREEFLANLDTFSHILPDGFRRKFRLEPLRKESAIDAVEKPLMQATSLVPRLKDIISENLINEIANKVVKNLLKIHVQRDDGTISVIKQRDVNRVAGAVFRKFRRIQVQRDGGQTAVIGEEFVEEFVEPVQLQVVCLKLWENKILTGKIQNEIDSIDFGDVDNALTEFYVDAVNAAKANVRRIKESAIRKWCEEQLITSAGTRSIVYQDVNNTAGMSNKVVDTLQEKYLVRAEERARGKWIELTHDRLIKPIKDSNKNYEEKEKRKKMKIVKIIVPTIIAISLFTIFISWPYFENINAQNKNVETMINNNITIKFSDGQTENGNNYVYFIKSYPKNGVIYPISNDTVVYNPSHRYVGHDTISYVVSNGVKNSNTGLIDIYTKPIPLTAMNQTAESIVDKPMVLSLIDWDYSTYTDIRDVGILPIKVLRGPYNGYITSDINSNKIIYTPHDGYNGGDFFEFCLPNPENTTLCSANGASFGHVNITVRTAPQYFGYLILDNGITQGTIYPIYSTTNTIGRATEHDNPDIAITDKIRTVSRLHGKIFYNGSYFLQDLESTNKIEVNGKKLDDREVIKLQGGDTFLMGDIRLRLITDLTDTTQYR